MKHDNVKYLFYEINNSIVSRIMQDQIHVKLWHTADAECDIKNYKLTQQVL